MMEYLQIINKEFLIPAIPILSILFGYLFAKILYFSQKEYELIIKRFLDEGIDIISKKADSALAIYRNNWTT